MPTIQRPNATVSYDVTGSGPPVVLGHSLFCTRRMWAGVVEELRERYCLINVELRGHGESTADAEFDLNDLVDDWLAILDKEGIDKALLCGLSTGGMTAMRLALRAPDRVVGLGLLDTAALAEPPVARIKYWFLAKGYEHLGILPTGELLRAMYCDDTIRDRPELTARLISEAKGFDRRHLGHAMSAVFGRDSIDVTPISRPALVIVGEHDRATPVAWARALADALGNAELEIVEGAGHLTAEERPSEVAGLLSTFFAGCSAESRA